MLRQVTPWRTASPLRGRTRPAKPSGMAIATPVGTTARPPPLRQDDVAAGHEVGAGVALAGVARHGELGVELVQGDAQHRRTIQGAPPRPLGGGR